MEYSEVKLVPLTPIRVGTNPSMPAAGKNDLVSVICHGESEGFVNELLSVGWELIQFTTHQSAEKDATAIVAILGKPHRRVCHDKESIDILGLAHRDALRLKGNDIFTIGDLLSKTETGLLKMPYVGRKTVQKVREALQKYDLSLRGPL